MAIETLGGLVLFCTEACGGKTDGGGGSRRGGIGICPKEDVVVAHTNRMDGWLVAAGSLVVLLFGIVSPRQSVSQSAGDQQRKCWSPLP